MQRILRYDHQDQPIGELSPSDVMAMARREEINGEHSLEITTLQVLGKGERLLYRDGRGTWREYEVAGVDEDHASGKRVVGTYYAVWSVQPDLLGVTVSKMPGVQVPVNAATALAAALESQSRWSVGTVTVTATGGASMYDMSAWKALGVLVENWGGELSTTIEVGSAGVTARRVDLYVAQGDQTPRRRYDFGADMRSIKRTVADEPLYCRVSPRGKGEETEDGGYGRKITIESVNDGVDWLEYAPMVDAAKLPDGNGGWQYPTKIIENPDMETPADLKAWALGAIAGELTPKVTYEVDVIQAAAEGADLHAVSLGDAVHAVDRFFGADGLRVEGRVAALETDELTGKSTSATIGYLAESLGSRLSTSAQVAQAAYERIAGLQATLSTAEYIDNLLGRINAEISADGGYTYIVPGEGLLAYDSEVSDPAVGAEASKVVQIKGGSIRIASTKTAQGAWEWRSVFVSGHIAAPLVTSAQLTTGYIGNASGSYWDLDNNVLRIGTGAQVGTRTIAELLSSVDGSVTDVDSAVEYCESQSATTPPQESDPGWSETSPAWREGWYIWQRTMNSVTTASGTTTTYSDPTCISGKDGDSGIGIVSTDIGYGTSASESVRPSSWTSAVPSVAQGEWLWTRTVYTYSDQSTHTTYAKTYSGTDGTSGLGISTTSVKYGKSSSASTPPSANDWSDNPPALNGGEWMWTRTVITYTDGTTSTSYSKAYVGTDGNDGTSVTILGSYSSYAALVAAHPTGSAGDSYIIAGDLYVWSTGDSDWVNVGTVQGPAGADGTSVTVSSIQYATSSSGSTSPSSGDWGSSVPTPSKGQWLWVKTTYSDASEVITKSYVGTDGEDGVSVTVKSTTKSGGVTTVVLEDSNGNEDTLTISDGSDGTNGSPGADGKSVHVAWATSADGSTGFSTSDGTGKTYIGVYADTSAADSSDPSDYTWSLIKGADGEDGADGVGISSVTVTYGTSGSASTQPSSWQSSIPTVQDGDYLWTRTVTDYTDPNMADTVAYTYSKQGEDGQQGQQGVAGTSVTVSGIQYQIGSSASTAPTGTWQNAPYDTTAEKPYLWTKTTFSDSTVAYGVAKRGDAGEQGPQGEKGEQGDAAVVYSIAASVDAVVRDGSAITPGSVTFSATSKAGDGSPTAYAGRIRIQTSDNGASWTTRYTSSSNEASYTYTPTSAIASSARYIRGILFKAGGTSVQLDAQTVAIVSDGANGADGTDGEDAYTVMLSNENHTFAGTETTAVGTSVIVEVIAYKGATRIATSIAQPTVKPTEGMTFTMLNNNSTSASVRITVTSLLNPLSGYVVFPVTADGKTFNLAFSYSVAFKGDSAVAYSITPSVDAVVRKDGAISPASVTFSARSKTGTANPASYAGRIRVQTSTDGSSWTPRYNSQSNEYGYEYAPDASTAKTMKYIKATLFKAGGTSVQLDEQTVAVVDVGADAYTVMLSNESHTFAGGKTGAIAASTTCDVIAYKGTTRVAATIGTISGKPSGMTTSISNNGTTSASFEVSVTTAMTTRSGVLGVPVTVDGKSFTLTFSYALALVGETGVGVSSIVPEYYLSTSSTTPTGSSSGWTEEEPAWQVGHYIWTRSHVYYDDGSEDTTEPVLAGALNSANEQAHEAAKVATNYLAYDPITGLDLGYSGTDAKTRITGSGVEVFDGDGKSALYAGVQNSQSLVRVGRSGNSRVDINGSGSIQLYAAGMKVADFGYGSVYSNSGQLGNGVYSTFGTRAENAKIGEHSSVMGNNCEAGTFGSHAEGTSTVATEANPTAIAEPCHAEGAYTRATGASSHAEGYSTEASGNRSHAEGRHTVASGASSHAEGDGGYGSSPVYKIYASGTGAHAGGKSIDGDVKAAGDYSFAHGSNAQATKAGAVAFGLGTTASGIQSFAGGNGSQASGEQSFSYGKNNNVSGNRSAAFGSNNTVSNAVSFAFGELNTIGKTHSGAFGRNNNVNANDSFAFGYNNSVTGSQGAAIGFSLMQSVLGQFVCGKFNSSVSNALFILGNGASSGRSNAMYATSTGNLWIAGTLTQNSDRRLKTHLAYLDADAVGFVRALKPALFEKDGARHVGFYAQDVDEADPWATATVEPAHTDESLGYDPLTLDYSALIAPLVAYAQHLEKEIEALRARIDALEGGSK